MPPENQRATDTSPAAPRRIEPRTTPASPPRGRSRRRAWIVSALVAALAVAGVVAFALTRTGGGSQPSDEDRIRTAIGTFTTALQDGDLASLRTATCGPLASFYGGISDDDFAATHDAAVAADSVPVVESVDTVQITEAAPPDQSTAIAQVTVRTDAPGTSVRTFDLALDGETWKVCA